MKYFCRDCKSELQISSREIHGYIADNCPVCCAPAPDRFVLLPEYETVEQWEKRCGRKYPRTAPLYELKPVAKGYMGWFLRQYQNADTANVCIVSDKSPPDDWRPE